MPDQTEETLSWLSKMPKRLRFHSTRILSILFIGMIGGGAVNFDNILAAVSGHPLLDFNDVDVELTKLKNNDAELKAQLDLRAQEHADQKVVLDDIRQLMVELNATATAQKQSFDTFTQMLLFALNSRAEIFSNPDSSQIAEGEGWRMPHIVPSAGARELFEN